MSSYLYFAELLEERKRKKRDESRGAVPHASGIQAGSRSAGPSPSVPSSAAPPHTPNIPGAGGGSSSTSGPRPASTVPPPRPSPLGANPTPTASPMKSSAMSSASVSASAGGAVPKPTAPAAHSRPAPQTQQQGAPPAAHQHSHSGHSMHSSGAAGGTHHPSPAKRGRPANHTPTSSSHFTSSH